MTAFFQVNFGFREFEIEEEKEPETQLTAEELEALQKAQNLAAKITELREDN